MNYPKQDKKLLDDSDEFLSELETFKLALNNLQLKEVYTISQEIVLKIGTLTIDQGLIFRQLLKEFQISLQKILLN